MEARFCNRIIKKLIGVFYYFIFYLTIQTPTRFWEKNAEKNSELRDLILFFFTIPSLHLAEFFFYWIEFTSCNSVFFYSYYVMGLKKFVAIFYFTIHFFLQLQVCVSQMRFSSENSQLLTIYILECLAILRLYLARKKGRSYELNIHNYLFNFFYPLCKQASITMHQITEIKCKKNKKKRQDCEFFWNLKVIA